MKNNMVRKSNFLVEASYKLSTQEQRVILFLASLIKPDDEEFKDYSISVKDFSELVGTNNKRKYADIKEITKKLISRVFSIKTKDDELQISWLSSARYVNGEGTVTLSFDQKLKPFLLQLKNRFTTYRLYQVMQLKSSFSIRIYELLKQYQKVGSRVFEISELRGKLGIEDSQYKNFNDFKRFVILVAQEELAAKTDLTFEFEEIKIGRSVGKIRFLIKELQKPLLEVAETQSAACQGNDSTLADLASIVPLPYRNQISMKKLLQEAVTRYGADYVMRNIVYTNDKSDAVTDGSKGNYRAYLAKSLRNDYGLAYIEDQQLKKEAEQLKQKTFEEAEKQKQRELNQIDQEREDRRKARIFMESYAAETMLQLEEEARQRLSPDALARYLSNHYTGAFEFKRKLEDVVMEHAGIRKPQPEAASEFPETTPAGQEIEAAAE